MLTVMLAQALLVAPLAAGELDLDAFTSAVLAANPEAAVAAATVEEARARAIGSAPWPSPMVDLSLAPLALADMPAWEARVEQPLPLWGMRRAASAMGEADAEAAEARLEMVRLDLAWMAAMAWSAWYRLHRELGLVADTDAILRELRATTLSRVASGRATDLAVLEVDAERAWLAARALGLEAERDVVAARINTLLHRPVPTAVDAPPITLVVPDPRAGAGRPEPVERAAMTRAAEADARMARAGRLPMLGVMAGWEAMAAMPEERLMTGVSIEVPLDQGALGARVAAAEARVEAARAAEAQAGDRVAEAEAAAARRLRAERETLDALDQLVLPVARARVSAARAGFAAGTSDLRSVLDAERADLAARVSREQALAGVVLRVRELELARGVPLVGADP
jgi:outer membrane protein TolC